jgi:hypothetical protein
MKRTQKRKSQKRPTKRPKKMDIMDKYSSGSIGKPIVKRVDVNTSVGGVVQFSNAITTGPLILLSGIAQGDTNYQRSGNHVVYKSLQARIRILADPLATGYYAADQIRMVILYDKQGNGTTPRVDDIIEAIGASPTNQAIDPFKFETRDRFLILKDWLMTMPTFSATVAGGVTTYTSQDPTFAKCKDIVLEFYKTFKFKLDAKFDSNTATVTDILSGAIWLFGIDNYASPTSPWSYQFSTSLVYSDVIG